MNRTRLVVIGVLLIATFRVWASGQDYKLSVDVELVQLPVSVIDKTGRPVDHLSKEHFQVFEGGIPQKITLFRHEDIPLSVALVIDNSGSMRHRRERANSAALTFARESNPEDETFIINFDDSVYLEQDFTSNISDLIAALDSIDTRGETAIYDAVFLAVEHLKEGRKDKKAILLISDGEDNASRYSFNKVMDALRESEVTLYAIGLLGDNDQRGGLFGVSPSRKAKEDLQKFARITGGQAYFPRSLDEIAGLCKTVAHDLRNHYTLGYTPSNKKPDGSWREIRVKVNAPSNVKGLTVRTKPGYYAPGVSR